MATGEVQINNGTFRVTKWTIEPNDAIPLHLHEFQYVVVPLTAGTMIVTSHDGAVSATELEFGNCYSRASGAKHTVANSGSHRIVFMEIEKLD